MTPEGQDLLLRGGDALGLDLTPHLPAFAELLRLLLEGTPAPISQPSRKNPTSSSNTLWIR